MKVRFKVSRFPRETSWAVLYLYSLLALSHHTERYLRWFMFSVTCKYKHGEGGVFREISRSITHKNTHTHTLLDMCAWPMHNSSTDNLLPSTQRWVIIISCCSRLQWKHACWLIVNPQIGFAVKHDVDEGHNGMHTRAHTHIHTQRNLFDLFV